MSRFLLALFTVFIAVALPVADAEAKRFGGGRSFGMQRNALPQKAPQSVPQKAPQREAGNAAPANAAGTPAAGKSSWLGPVAGIAAGLGLAALVSHLGLGEEFASFLLIALLALAAFFLFRRLMRPRTALSAPMQYAGAAGGAAASGGATPFPGVFSGSGAATADLGTGRLPPGFDVEAFARQAKLNFIRLQAASDAGNLDDIREFTSPEMYAEISLQLSERGAAPSRTEVVELDAEVLDASEAGQRQIVSVRFHGLIREDGDTTPTAFDEVWHLTRPASGKGGWVVAGIQQMA